VWRAFLDVVQKAAHVCTIVSNVHAYVWVLPILVATELVWVLPILVATELVWVLPILVATELELSWLWLYGAKCMCLQATPGKLSG
jgi:hypothetical protein